MPTVSKVLYFYVSFCIIWQHMRGERDETEHMTKKQEGRERY